jgi:hypothetical protein
MGGWHDLMECIRLKAPSWRAPRAPALVCCTCAALALLTMLGGPAWPDDSPVTTTAGYEYYTGPDHQLTRTVAGELEARLLGGGASLVLGRFDDEGAGVGLKVGGGLGVPLAPRTQLKLGVERSLGDSSYRAWEFKAGPAINLLRGQTLTLTYVHSQDNEDAASNGAGAELEVPLIVDHLSASGSVSYARVKQLGGVEGMAGLSASPVDHLEIEAEVGYTQTGIGLQGLFPGRHVIHRGQKKAGRTSTTGTSSPVETPGAIAQLAVRVSFP